MGPEDCVIVGNTALYGATGGRAFLNGRAGERFCVRNSMAEAVVEGTGDHCCEYMTGGAVVVLGKVGRNVGAGMTGGLGYFLDEEGTFPAKVNSEIVSVQRVVTAAGAAQLRSLIEQHVERTGSPKGRRILDDWEAYLPQFWQVVPPSEQDTPEASTALRLMLPPSRWSPKRPDERQGNPSPSLEALFFARTNAPPVFGGAGGGAQISYLDKNLVMRNAKHFRSRALLFCRYTP